MSDVPSYDKPPAFTPSDLTALTSRVEGWRKLALQMQPSQGPGSGQLDPKNVTAVNDAQWLRRFNLTIYAAGLAPPSAQPAPVTNLVSQPQLRNGSGNGSSSITLDPVDVIAKPPSSATQQGLDLSNLRCQFNIQKNTNSTPNKLYARIYNMAPATMAKVIEMHRVQIQAGYWFSNYGIIFDGTVVQYVRGKENPVDTFLDIYAGDGDLAMSASTFTVIPGGSSVQAKYDAIYKSYQEQQPDLRKGQQDQQNIKDKTIRDQVMVGTTRSLERDLYMQYNQDIHIDSGEWNVVLRTGYKPGDAVILSPKTGLVGLPEVTPEGIQARCLLNPKLRLGGLVQIDASVLSGVAYVPGAAGQTVENPQLPPSGIIQSMARYDVKPGFEHAFTSPSGRYKIIYINYVGDTWGQPWNCELSCIAVGSDGKVDPKLVNPRSARAWSASAVPGAPAVPAVP
jgi:hypothetical protein